MSRFGAGGGRFRGNGGRSRGRGGRGARALAEYPFIAETRDLLAKVQNKGVRGDWEDVVNRGWDVLEGPFAVLLQYFLEVDLEDTWLYVVRDKPPWTASMVLSVAVDNERSCTDQGFNPMLRVQLDALTSLAKSLSHGENPGPARALQIIRLIHDMFFSAPRRLPPGGCGTTTASAEEARQTGMEAAKALYQECVDLINAGIQEGGPAAWDERGAMGGNSWEGESGWNQGYKRGHSTVEQFGSNDWGGPSKVLHHMNSAPPSFGMGEGQAGSRPSPPLQTTGRGPPPSMRPQARPPGGIGLRTSGRGPPPSMGPSFGMDRPSFNDGPLGPRPNQGLNSPGMRPPGFGSSAFGGPMQASPGLNSQSFNSSASSPGLPGQPSPFGSIQPPQQEFPRQNPFGSSPGLPGQPNPFRTQSAPPPGFGSIDVPMSGSSFRSGTLQPPQRPVPMPTLRGRGPRPAGRGPPPSLMGQGRGAALNDMGFSPTMRPSIPEQPSLQSLGAAKQPLDAFDWSMGTPSIGGLGGDEDGGWAMGTGGRNLGQNVGGFGGGGDVGGFGQTRSGDSLAGNWGTGLNVNGVPRNDRFGGGSTDMGGEHWRSAC